MAFKWRHRIWMFLCIHKTLSVIHVIEGFRGHIIHFYWYYVHLTSLEPIFWSSEQDAQNQPRSPPPKNHFHRAKWLCDATKSTRSTHFRSSWCILQSPSLQKILQEAQVCFNSVLEQKYQPWTLITPSFGSQWCIQSLKIIFQFHEYCARGLSKFKLCMEVLRSAYIINIVALKGS